MQTSTRRILSSQNAQHWPLSVLKDVERIVEDTKSTVSRNDYNVFFKEQLRPTMDPVVLEEEEEEEANAVDPKVLLVVAASVFAAAGAALLYALGLNPADVHSTINRFMSDPQEVLQDVVDSVESMGPAGAIYFMVFYCVAEIFALPMIPLTLSAGYLFGLYEGVAVVLLAGTVAACVGFFIGKTFLREYVEGILDENPKFAKIDRAIGREGFKLLLLLRMTPIFPFAMSNYVYGASSISFVPYFFGTALGFLPGTIGYVYTGMVGKALTLGDGDQPWYVYGLGLGALIVILKLITDVAARIVEAVEDEH